MNASTAWQETSARPKYQNVARRVGEATSCDLVPARSSYRRVVGDASEGRATDFSLDAVEKLKFLGGD